MAIRFYYQEPKFKLKSTTAYKKWLEHVAQAESKGIESLTYILCTDEYLLQINKEHLNHDYYTDIVTFNLTEEGSTGIVGEIYISIDRVKENAITLKEPYLKEFARVLVHGMLHLCGYDDQTEADKTKMRGWEDRYLTLL